MSSIFKWSLFLSLIFSAPQSFAQSKSENNWIPEVGFFTGPFLVSKASRVLPSVGGRISIELPSNLIDHLEFQGFGSNIDGVSYYLGQFGLRNEFDFNKIKALFLFGFDWHFVRSRNAEAYTPSQGWHIGTGINLEVTKNFFLRNDYIMRFGTRRALLITVGFSFSYGAGES